MPAAQSEAQRFERLRAQDGQPMVPPPSMQGLVARGGLDPAKLTDALGVWEAARAEMQTHASFPAEERLFWTAFMLARHYAEHDARPRAMELIHASLGSMHDPRHRQVILGLGARNAAVLGDLGTAQSYVAQLDPRSDDLQVDTNYRFSATYVALLGGDAQTALQLLGWRVEDVPISDAYDTVCGVLRAHAHEMTGQLSVAQEQLMKFAATPDGLAMVEDIARSNKALQLVPQSLPPVAERVRQMYANVVVTKSGINVGRLVLVPIIGSALAFGAHAVATSLPSPWSSILPGVMIGAVVLLSTVFALRMVFKGPMLRKRLAKTGVAGTAQLLVIQQTGTRVNEQPMVKLRLLVQLPDRAPYTALHHEIVPLIRLRELAPGANVGVRVDPADPTLMAVAWA